MAKRSKSRAARAIDELGQAPQKPEKPIDRLARAMHYQHEMLAELLANHIKATMIGLMAQGVRIEHIEALEYYDLEEIKQVWPLIEGDTPKERIESLSTWLAKSSETPGATEPAQSESAKGAQ